MDFGRLSLSEIDIIDFELPAGDASILPGKPDAGFRFYFGAPRHGTADWKGNLYPAKVKDSEFHKLYWTQFNYLESGATFYQMPNPEHVIKWANATPGDARVILKMPRQVTHLQRLQNAGEYTDQVFDICARAYGNRLSRFFLQIPDNWGFKHLGTLEKYLKEVPSGMKLNLELRNPEWYVSSNFSVLVNLLIANDVGLILSDTFGRRDVLHNHLTCDQVQIRFNGKHGHPSDEIRLQGWKDKISQWKERGIKQVYFALHQEDQRTFHEAVAVAKKVFGDWIKLPEGVVPERDVPVRDLFS